MYGCRQSPATSATGLEEYPAWPASNSRHKLPLSGMIRNSARLQRWLQILCRSPQRKCCRLTSLEYCRGETGTPRTIVGRSAAEIAWPDTACSSLLPSVVLQCLVGMPYKVLCRGLP
eukprot:7381201-Prymnesium_polylepis.4